MSTFSRTVWENRGRPTNAPPDAQASSRPTEAQAPRHNLPTRLTRFIGREAMVLDIRGLLRENRLLTLTGTGGAGKTRLAQEVAADVFADFPDGVWQVELAPLAPTTDTAMVARAVITALGIKELAGQSAQEAAIEHLKAKQALLLLDNCEHLLGACAPLVAGLLEACSHLRVLATSRELLGITGEQNYRVPSLTLPDPRQSKKVTADKLASFEAVRLFVDRAALAQHGFKITDGNAPLVVRVCQRLDGMPLALELAAARTRTLPLEQIADRLDDRFRLLTGGDRAALPRQQTLRALVDWSYDLLTDAEKTLFARLSVFAGGWTLDAAQTVCDAAPLDAADIPDLLASLADKSLVQAEEQADGSVRYGMLETLRQYAAEKAEASREAAEVRARHRNWCVAMAEEADREIFGPDQILWLTRLETDHANLRAALDGFETTFPKVQDIEQRTVIAQQALRLSVSLGFFWQVRGYTAEARGCFAWILRASKGEVKSSLPASTVARAYCMAANLSLQQGDSDEARAHFAESLTLYRALGERRNIALVLGNLGIVAAGQKDWASAWTLLKEALDVARAWGDKIGIAAALCNLGHVATNRGENSVAWELLTEARELFRAVGENHGVAMTLNNLGDVAVAQGDCASAQPLFEEALALRRTLEDRRGISFSLRGLAEVRLLNGEAQDAVVLWAAADALRESIALTLPPVDQAKYEQGLEKARATLLTGDETAFSAAWDEGYALSWEQAVAYALGEGGDGNAER